VDDAIEDSVSDGRLADHVMPSRHGELGGDQCRFPAVAFLEDLEQIKALLIVETMRSPVIKNEQLDAGQLVNHAREATIETREGKIFEQAQHTQVENRVILAVRLPPERTSQLGFSGTGLAGDDEILVGIEPGALGCVRQVLQIAAGRLIMRRDVGRFFSSPLGHSC